MHRGTSILEAPLLLFPQEESIQERFAAFDAAHPEIWALFVRFAREARDAGRIRFSADAILHRIRWECDVNERRDGGFKCNDQYAGRYARKLIAEDESFADFFELRGLRTA